MSSDVSPAPAGSSTAARNLRGLLASLASAVVLTGALSASAQEITTFREGTLPRQWSVAGPTCAEQPDFQVHRYNPDFYILRQSGCTHHEKPFIYLIFGDDEVLMLDTGAGIEEDLTTTPMDIVTVVDHVIEDWLMANGRDDIPLLVSHLHSHGDHTAGDEQLAARPNTTVIAPSVEAISEYFGITTWPEEIVEYDLGDRIVDIIAIPGHDQNSFAYYDHETGLLLTGDSFYPGRIYVNGDPLVFIASHQRLVDFALSHTVTSIPGTHIEQSRTPFVDYPVGTVYQPDETPLEMTVGQLLELNEYFKTMGETFVPHRFAGYSICGGYPTCEAQTVTVTE